MSDERHMHNAPDVKHAPRGEGMSPNKYCFGCDEWKSPLGFRGACSVTQRCATCDVERTAKRAAKQAQREVTA